MRDSARGGSGTTEWMLGDTVVHGDIKDKERNIGYETTYNQVCTKIRIVIGKVGRGSYPGTGIRPDLWLVL